MVANASKLSFFYRDPERPFDIERPRNCGARLEQNSMG